MRRCFSRARILNARKAVKKSRNLKINEAQRWNNFGWFNRPLMLLYRWDGANNEIEKECSALLLTTVLFWGTATLRETRRGLGYRWTEITLTCVKDVAVFIFWVHAVGEKFSNFIVSHFFTWKNAKERYFSIRLTFVRVDSPKAFKLCSNSAPSMVPFSALSYNFKHSRKSS